VVGVGVGVGSVGVGVGVGSAGVGVTFVVTGVGVGTTTSLRLVSQKYPPRPRAAMTPIITKMIGIVFYLHYNGVYYTYFI
jgi:hypothetical protein